MDVSDYHIGEDRERSNWVRLRTLLRVRWFAIAGQSAAILVAVQLYGLQMQTGYATAVIGLAIIANLYFTSVYPENKRLSEREAFFMLIIDIFQLTLLLYVTGGLVNPFAVLILAPVTIAATVLQLRSTLVLGMVAITLISLISQFSQPIATADGIVLTLPPLIQFGFWTALVIGITFLAVYARQVTMEMHTMAEALLATQLALAREQKLTDLGGVVAAAAHELGTPLSTIKLISSELMEDLSENTDHYDDVVLIGEQADRCRDILRSMGRAGKDDLHVRHAPLETVVREAAEPHMNRGKTVMLRVGPMDDDSMAQPSIPRRPEIVHGLRNLIQNAVDFAETSVQIEVAWGEDLIKVRIMDDGAGFPASVIGRIGDPFVRRRRQTNDRPGYEGMGLGMFIAKTLLERSGATLTFANSRIKGQAGWAGQPLGGAIVSVRWPRNIEFIATPDADEPLGENQQFS
ncbi:ActS/PrrB/RegB family redox-sensitive histidine kinase [Rhodobacteraceae bacterium S2214]|nr:ActS/PrrB/RegB family redox-sensitive histidine kinase [Rhodobacteraceae bacterium S2214]